MRKKSRYSAGVICACLIGMAAGSALCAVPAGLVDARLPSYQPQPVAVEKAHGYVQPDGSIQIVGFDDMAGMLASLNKLFVQSHPGFRFKMEMKGNGPAIPALTYDASAFAPVGGGATVLQLLPYEKIHGSKAEPVAALAIRVAHSSLNRKAKLGALGLVVNKKNPIKSLTMEQVTAMFGYGSGSGDITAWNQLGVSGALDGKAIHPTGLSEDAYDRPEDLGMGEYMMFQKMGPFPGVPFSPRYERMKRYADVVGRVSEDPLAVGLVALNKVNATVRVVPLVGNDGKTLTSGSAADLVAGKYPYERYLYIYVRRPVGEAFDPFVKEYLRMMLSKQGQQLIAQDAKGYLPLSLKEVEEELAKIERAKVWEPRNKQGPQLNYPFPSPQP
jgi:phosphate transport system substrate-binding protein